MAAVNSTRKLILHFDVNETIMLGDPAGGDTFEESINKCICKNAYIKKKNGMAEGVGNHQWDGYTWHDGSPFNVQQRDLENHPLPPPLITSFDMGGDPDNICVYKTSDLKALYAKSFTEGDSPGIIYRDLYEQIEKAMRIPEGFDIDPRLTHDGVHYLVSFHHRRSLLYIYHLCVCVQIENEGAFFFCVTSHNKEKKSTSTHISGTF